MCDINDDFVQNNTISYSLSEQNKNGDYSERGENACIVLKEIYSKCLRIKLLEWMKRLYSKRKYQSPVKPMILF